MLATSILESLPSFFGEQSLTICIGNLCVVHESERCAFDGEDQLHCVGLHAIFEVSKLLAVQVEIMLRWVLVLNMLTNFCDVCLQVTGVCFNDIGGKEFDELFLA